MGDACGRSVTGHWFCIGRSLRTALFSMFFFNWRYVHQGQNLFPSCFFKRSIFPFCFTVLEVYRMQPHSLARISCFLFLPYLCVGPIREGRMDHLDYARVEQLQPMIRGWAAVGVHLSGGLRTWMCEMGIMWSCLAWR